MARRAKPWPVRLLRFEPQLVPVLGVCIASVQVALLYRADRSPEMVVSLLVARPGAAGGGPGDHLPRE